jgi:hypothetical protein
MDDLFPGSERERSVCSYCQNSLDPAVENMELLGNKRERTRNEQALVSRSMQVFIKLSKDLEVSNLGKIKKYPTLYQC